MCCRLLVLINALQATIFFSLDSADPKLQPNLLQVFSELLWVDALQHNANRCQDGSDCHHVSSKSLELLGMDAHMFIGLANGYRVQFLLTGHNMGESCPAHVIHWIAHQYHCFISWNMYTEIWVMRRERHNWYWRRNHCRLKKRSCSTRR